MIIKNAYEFIEKGYAEHFTLTEWPVPEDLRFVDYKVIEYLDDLRESFGHAIYPSQLPAGLVRNDGSQTSRHYVGDGQLGQAVDVFPSVNTLECWLKAIENRAWFGIGVYLDTNVSRMQPQPMLHLDIDNSRSSRSLWVRDGDYIFKSTNPEKFWKKLSEAYRT